jgi:ankyrin repeat protein
MPQHQLPASPSLEHLKNQARSLLREQRAPDPAPSPVLDPSPAQRFTAHGIASPQPKLSDALHVIAREYGFETWPALKLHVELQTADPVAALTAAIKANDAAAVRLVLTRHPSLASRIDQPLPDVGFDEPALLAAVHKQNRDMIDALLDFGANINQRSLWWAGGFGVLDSAGPDLAAYLIARGATLDIHSTARLGHVERVRELLHSNPGLVHARGGDGQLPLHFASTIEIAALLLDHGADINARDIDHESTAAQYMVCQKPNRHDIVRFLITRGAQTDLLMASALGDLALVESILNDDPETIRTTATDRYFPRQNPKSGGTIYVYGFGLTKTAHMLAHELGHAAVFDLLMQRSPAWLRLIHAAELGDESLTRQILQKHPALFTRLTANASRRLIGTAIRNNDRAVTLLLEAGWPANPMMDNHQTALHYAAWHGNLPMVQALLQHNAPIDITETEHGGTPLDWALYGSLHGWHRDKGDYPGTARALLAAGAALPQQETPLKAAEDVLEVLRHAPHP